MGDLRTIKADGHSPFTRYTNLLLYTTQNLRHFVERDREAMELLSAQLSLPVALQRAEKWYWARRIAQDTEDRVFKFPRVWTRRDQRVLLVTSHTEISYEPTRRCDRIVAYLSRNLSRLRRDVIQELTSSHKIATLGPRIEAAQLEFQQLCDHARQAAYPGKESDTHDSNMRQSSDRLEQLVVNWMDWTEAPKSAGPASVGQLASGERPASSSLVQAEKSEECLSNSQRAKSDSRRNARAAYDYACANIPGSHAMTVPMLFEAIQSDGEVAHLLPPTPDTFRRYLNDCGIRHKKNIAKEASRSVVKKSEI